MTFPALARIVVVACLEWGVRMEPVSLIVGALTAGLASGLQGTATEAVKEAYAELKELVGRLFSDRNSGAAALEQYEQRPEAWRPALEAELVEVDAGNDRAVIEAAQRLMALLDTVGARAGKYQIDLRGSQAVQVGNHNTQHNVFGTGPES
ncbi:RIP homotypic interaction motif-containing protein [Pseudonocardia eucalypti]|uniref:RIP homotypic interaction motif-containing protein n=1 Tax=Pseudonocardia eucalypti TaxID=648755 RepID=A0ABP9Q4K1_9PSEU|nr:hypothetical protein [Pseudonocardia eucalypti]